MTVPADIPDANRLRVLHLIHVLGPTNSQYNEHCLPQLHVRDISICTFFPFQLRPADGLVAYEGDGTVVGFIRLLWTVLHGVYDVVHAHSPQMATFLSLAFALHPRGRRLRRISVYTVHDSFHDYKPRNKLLMLSALLFFAQVVFCGQAAYESYPRILRRLVGKRARVVQNGADFDRVRRAVAGAPVRVADAPFTILSVARLEPVKDPSAVVGAFARVADRHARLVIVGTGSLEESLRREIQALGLADRVELTGLIARDEVFRRAAAADAFVSASRGEGLPVAVMEVMAANCPVVLTDIPPHREVTAEADFVSIVPVGDTAALARELDRLRALSAVERHALGRRGGEYVNARFPLSRMHDGYATVYADVATSNGHRVS